MNERQLSKTYTTLWWNSNNNNDDDNKIHDEHNCWFFFLQRKLGRGCFDWILWIGKRWWFLVYVGGGVRRSLFFSLLFVQCIHYSGCRCIHIFVFFIFFFIIIPMFTSTHIEFIWQMSKKGEDSWWLWLWERKLLEESANGTAKGTGSAPQFIEWAIGIRAIRPSRAPGQSVLVLWPCCTVY